MTKRLTKTSYKQYEEILNFVKSNKIIVTGKSKPFECKKINLLWEQFFQHINALGYGPQKTADQWRHVFNEWKTNTKRKSRDIKRAISGTGGGPPTTKKLTDLEEQLLSIIGLIHLGDESVADSLQLENHTNKPIGEVQCTFEGDSEEIFKCQELGADVASSTIEIIELEDHDYIPHDSGEKLSFKADASENILMTTSEVSRPGCSKSNSNNTQQKGKKARSILQEAVKDYGEAQKVSLLTAKSKVEAISKLADSVNSYANVNRAALKLEYFKVFKCYDGFEELFQ